MSTIIDVLPFELLEEIFSYLNVRDVLQLTEDPLFGQLAFQRKYNRVFLSTEIGFECMSRDFMMVSVDRLVQLVKRSPGFVPNLLLLDKFEDFKKVNSRYPGLFQKFKGIEHFTKLTTASELDQLAECRNIKDIFIYEFEEINRRLSKYSLPDSLLTIRLLDMLIDVPFPSTIERISMHRASSVKTSYLPTNLKSLELRNLKSLTIDAPFPLGITELRLSQLHRGGLTGISPDFSGFENLTRLSIEGIDWDTLKLPQNLRFLGISNCRIVSIEKIKDLRRLLELQITSVWVSDYAVFDINYPNLLKSLIVSCTLSKTKEEDFDVAPHGLPSSIFTLVPSCLKDSL